MNDNTKRTAKTIRINEDSYHQARIASVSSRKSLGLWLEEAIREKLHPELRPPQR
jgi:hypothetical protein